MDEETQKKLIWGMVAKVARDPDDTAAQKALAAICKAIDTMNRVGKSSSQSEEKSSAEDLLERAKAAVAEIEGAE